jgi:hypothetical protein
MGIASSRVDAALGSGQPGNKVICQRSWLTAQAMQIDRQVSSHLEMIHPEVVRAKLWRIYIERNAIVYSMQRNST